MKTRPGPQHYTSPKGAVKRISAEAQHKMDAIRALDGTKTIQELADMFNQTYASMARFLWRHELKYGGAEKVWEKLYTHIKLEDVGELVRAGKTEGEMAGKLGCTLAYIRSLLAEERVGKVVHVERNLIPTDHLHPAFTLTWCPASIVEYSFRHAGDTL